MGCYAGVSHFPGKLPSVFKQSPGEGWGESDKKLELCAEIRRG